MVCGWLNGSAPNETCSTAGFTFVEAVEDGWWYTGPLPSNRRILAFYTDIELPSSNILRSTSEFLEYASRPRHLKSVLLDCGFCISSGGVRMNVSSGGRLQAPARFHWFAVGDAAVHFDPISSQGLFNALFTGLAAAEASDRLFAGEDQQQLAETYSRLIQGIGDAYLQRLKLVYQSEARWPRHSFWLRRRALSSGVGITEASHDMLAGGRAMG